MTKYQELNAEETEIFMRSFNIEEIKEKVVINEYELTNEVSIIIEMVKRYCLSENSNKDYVNEIYDLSKDKGIKFSDKKDILNSEKLDNKNQIMFKELEIIDTTQIYSCESSRFIEDETIEKDYIISDEFEIIYKDLEKTLNNTFDNKKAVKYINKILANKEISNSKISLRGAIDEGLLSRILSGKTKATKDAAIKICIGSELLFNECQDVMMRLGYILSVLNYRDGIIKYGIENNFDTLEIDYVLKKLGEKGLIRD